MISFGFVSFLPYYGSLTIRLCRGYITQYPQFHKCKSSPYKPYTLLVLSLAGSPSARVILLRKEIIAFIYPAFQAYAGGMRVSEKKKRTWCIGNSRTRVSIANISTSMQLIYFANFKLCLVFKVDSANIKPRAQFHFRTPWSWYRIFQFAAQGVLFRLAFIKI